MGAGILDREMKPDQRGFDPGIVTPRWWDLWSHAVFFPPYWEGGGERVDLITGDKSSSEAGVWADGEKGKGFLSTAGETGTVWANNANWDLDGDIDFTIWIALRKDGTSGAGAALFSRRTDTGDGYIVLGGDASPGDMKLEWWDGSFIRNVNWGAGSMPADGDITVGVTRKIGGDFELFISGVSKGVQTDANALTAGSQVLALGSTFTNRTIQGQYYSAFILKGLALSGDDFVELENDNFAHFRMADGVGVVIVPAVAAGGNPWNYYAQM